MLNQVDPNRSPTRDVVKVLRDALADRLWQEQRRRAQEQAIERERTLQAPKVELQAAARPEIDDGKLPVETPRFRLDELKLEVPPGLSETVEAAGARAIAESALPRRIDVRQGLSAALRRSMRRT